MKLICLDYYLIISIFANSEKLPDEKSESRLSNFRKKVEEFEIEPEDELENEFVSFLIKNAKHFDETQDNDEISNVTESFYVTPWLEFELGNTSKLKQSPKLFKQVLLNDTSKDFGINEHRHILKNQTVLLPSFSNFYSLSTTSSYLDANSYQNYLSNSFINATKNDESIMQYLNSDLIKKEHKIPLILSTKPIFSKNVTIEQSFSQATDYGLIDDENSVLLSVSPDLTIDNHENVILYENFTFSNTTREKNEISNKSITMEDNINSTAKNQLIDIPKEVMILKKAEEEEIAIINSSVTLFRRDPIDNISCIICNNIELEECNDPRHKLIPSTICKNADEACYTLQTPFGIVTRGCISSNRHMSIYVCSCNLCNHLPVSNIPVLFPNLDSWAENVIEMSRTKNFRKSIFKKMSCLSCMVNLTRAEDEFIDADSCLNGRIKQLSKVECKEQEICGIKALRSEGYVWRGCLDRPIYNYWWTFCDSDLCNTDPIVSIYDSTL